MRVDEGGKEVYGYGHGLGLWSRFRVSLTVMGTIMVRVTVRVGRWGEVISIQTHIQGRVPRPMFPRSLAASFALSLFLSPPLLLT